MTEREDVARPLERGAVCACGAPFTQSSIPTPLAAEAMRRGALAALELGVPGGWTPRRCPKCERRALDLEHTTKQPELLTGGLDP